MATVQLDSLASNDSTDRTLRVDQHGWGFVGLLCVVCALFLRPADIIPQFRDAPIYQWLIVSAMVLSYKAIGDHLQIRLIAYRPVTACLILLVGSVALSHIANGFLWGAHTSAWMATKVFMLYLLMVSVINTPQRLEAFTRWLVIAISTMSLLALADNSGWIDLAAFSPIDENNGIARIRGSGIFEDPNDLGLVLVIGILLGFRFLTKPKQGWIRYVWLIPLIILSVTLTKTFSRGAFLALASAIPAWIYFLRGWKFALLGSMMIVPVVAIAFAGRMTDFNSIYEGTGQTRIQIWSDTLSIFRQHPLFGIGEGMVFEEIGFVSHNSFLQGFAELGFLGGTLFVGIFLVAMVGLMPTREPSKETSPENQLQGAIFAVLIAYAVGILTLSRQFVARTFMVLGLAVAAQLTRRVPLPHAWRLGNELAFRSTLASLIFLACTYLATRLLIHIH